MGRTLGLDVAASASVRPTVVDALTGRRAAAGNLRPRDATPLDKLAEDSRLPRPPPRNVVLFSGHMIDAPDRKSPRFPASKAPPAAREIAKALDGFEIGPHDLAICGGACGGDLIFAEEALARKAALELYLPFETTQFLEKSVDFAGEAWRARFFAAEARAALHLAPRELGPLGAGEDPYERVNEWMLSAAIRFGAEKLRFVCLWDGSGADGPGGTGHMMGAVRKLGVRTARIDTTKLST